ncbi:MAG: hypothetical protein JF588_13845 [Caulobacterales bacterium]|nr:hypothetical protein [Caulobacterales bacterium]
MPTATITRQPAVADVRPPIVMVDPQAPASPELKALLTDVQNKMKLSFAMAAAGVAPAQPSATDKLFQSFMANRPQAKRDKARAHAQTLLSAAPAVRQTMFGRYGVIESAAYKGADQAQQTLGVTKVDGAKLQASLTAFGENDAAQVVAPPASFAAKTLTAIDLSALRRLKPIDPDVLAGAKYKKLGLFINSVHCIEETDGWGSDEIAMGGVATAPDGTTFKIGEFMVSDDFDAGETKTYSGKGKLFHEFNIRTDKNWPHVYACVVCMAEKDGSGFGDFLTQLWDKVGDEVKAAIAGAVGGAIGAALGSFFGPLGTALGTAIGWLLGALVNWILGFFQDDIVANHTILLGLGAATKSYYDWAKLTADPPHQFSVDYNGDGGRYRVWFSLSVYP